MVNGIAVDEEEKQLFLLLIVKTPTITLADKSNLGCTMMKLTIRYNIANYVDYLIFCLNQEKYVEKYLSEFVATAND